MGKWIKKNRWPHTCGTPIEWPWIADGSVWQCKCGKQWRIRTNWRGVRVWDRVTKITPPPPPPPPSACVM
jgi:hypothetical protein